MPISKTDQLFALIKSLTKSEKRNFRIYAQRISEGDGLQYLKIFDLLDKQKQLDEPELKRLFPANKLPNFKRHLYSQLLTSLRQLHIKKKKPIQIRAYLDFANVLYGKGLYLQSLKLLKKAKDLADKSSRDILALEILEFEKIIESRHITRSGAPIVSTIAKETNDRLAKVTNITNLSNLALLIHGWYIQNGHVKSEEESLLVRSYLEEYDPGQMSDDFGITEKAYYYQVYVWYNYILLDFEKCYDYAKKWVDLFKGENMFGSRDVNLLLRGYHYLLTAAFNLQDSKLYDLHLAEIEKFRKEEYKHFNKNTQIISFLYVHNGRLNRHILNKDYASGLEVIPKTLRRIRRYRANLDNHRILVLYYKIAWIYLMSGKSDLAIKYLHRIINTKMENLRQDIQGYSRLAFLMAHYDAKNYDLLDYLVRDIIKFLKTVHEDSELHQLTLSFFRKVNNVPLSERKDLMKALLVQLKETKKKKHELRGFFYLDIVSWLEKSLKRR